MIGIWICHLIRDIRYAFRMLAKNPSFTAIVVLTLALGITASTTIFSWISMTLLDPIPGASRSGEMVSVMKGEWSEHPTPPLCYPDYADLCVRITSFSGILADHNEFAAIADRSKPDIISGREFSLQDTENAALAVIVNKAFVDRY